jgi:hypothetical protein
MNALNNFVIDISGGGVNPGPLISNPATGAESQKWSLMW